MPRYRPRSVASIVPQLRLFAETLEFPTRSGDPFIQRGATYLARVTSQLGCPLAQLRGDVASPGYETRSTTSTVFCATPWPAGRVADAAHDPDVVAFKALGAGRSRPRRTSSVAP